MSDLSKSELNSDEQSKLSHVNNKNKRSKNLCWQLDADYFDLHQKCCFLPAILQYFYYDVVNNSRTFYLFLFMAIRSSQPTP